MSQITPICSESGPVAARRGPEWEENKVVIPSGGCHSERRLSFRAEAVIPSGAPQARSRGTLILPVEGGPARLGRPGAVPQENQKSRLRSPEASLRGVNLR